MTQQAQNHIEDPFSTIYDVTKETPLEKVPPEYWLMEQKVKDEKEAQEKFKNALEAYSKNPEVEKLLFDEIHNTVSQYDDNVVKTVLYVALSMYAEPLNLALKAESGTGKTYSTVETLKLFPEEDIQFIGSQSPKVITHLNGVKKAKDGRIIDDAEEPKKPIEKDFKDPQYGYGDAERKAFADAKKKYIDDKAQWDEDQKECYYEVILQGKTSAFLENFNIETFKMYKSTMSHDHPYIEHPWVDDKGRVHKTRLIGWPVVIRNAVDTEYNAEQATRDLTVTPSDRAEKIEQSMEISNNVRAYPWKYKQESFDKKIIKEYIRKIRDYVKRGKINVVVPFEGIKDGFSKEVVRDMRDFNKFLELTPTFALFKLFQRPIVMIEGKRYLIPTIEDAINAKTLYDAILSTTKTNTDQRIIDFYNTVVKGTGGISAEDLTDRYNKGRKHPITVARIRQWLQRLAELEWVDIREATERNEKGYIDRRYNAYYPLKNASNTYILQTDVDLKAILEKGFENWLKNTPIQTDTPIIILHIDGTAKAITKEEMINLIKFFGGDTQNINIVSKGNLGSISKNKPESTSIPEIDVKDAFFTKRLYYEQIPRKAGVLCSASDSGGCNCTFEAEFNLNENLYCPTHFKEQCALSTSNGFLIVKKEAV